MKLINRRGQEDCVNCRELKHRQGSLFQIEMAQRSDDHSQGIGQERGEDKVNARMSQGRFAKGKSNQWQAVIAIIGKHRGNQRRNQRGALEMQKQAAHQGQQGGSQHDAYCQQAGLEDFPGRKLTGNQQVKNQDRAKEIEREPPHRAGINLQKLAQRKTCRADQHDGQEVVGEDQKKIRK